MSYAEFPEVTFVELNTGDIFVYGDNMFVKKEIASRQFNAEDVETAELWEFDEDDKVLLIKKG